MLDFRSEKKTLELAISKCMRKNKTDLKRRRVVREKSHPYLYIDHTASELEDCFEYTLRGSDLSGLITKF